jgi:alcohol dehydrogenase class IV
MPASAPFTITPPGVIEFGAGAISRLPDAVAALHRKRAFLVTDPGIRAAGILGRVEQILDAGLIECVAFADVEANPSIATIDSAAALVREFGDAVVVAVGGGSSMDAAKGIALAATNGGSAGDFDFAGGGLAAGLPVVAVPTTAGTGAETNGFGVIEDTATHRKVYIGDGSVSPRVSILDPELTLGLPAPVTAATGVDALVHAIESLTSRGRNGVSEAYAHQAARLIHAWLPTAVADGGNIDARAQMLLGSHLSGLALSISGLGLVHGIAHAVTAHTGAVHGIALSAVLTAVMEFNLATSTAEYAQLAVDLGVASPAAAEAEAALSAVRAVEALVAEVGTYRSLGELGCVPDLVPHLVRTTLADAVTGNTPRLPSPEELADLLEAAL